MPRPHLVPLALGALLLLSREVEGSGSYRAVPVRPGQVDTRLYHMGKDIFTGELGPQALQATTLEEIESELPANVRTKANLSRLSGKLNAYQVEALSYFIAVEHGIDSLEPQLYEEGKAVFEGTAAVAKAAGAAASRQELELADWEAMLPEAGREQAKFGDYAGRLTGDQMAALGYYIAVTHRLPAIDQKTYDLGKSIFEGRIAATEGMNVAASRQERRLAALEAKLPQDARAKADLPALAGKLGPQQMSALEYFLHVRYGIKP